MTKKKKSKNGFIELACGCLVPVKEIKFKSKGKTIIYYQLDKKRLKCKNQKEI